MKLFGFPLSPFVRKVSLVAAEKGIAMEPVAVNPRNPSPEFMVASPFRKIPALQDGDFSLSDSTAIVTYLDALHPAPAMLPGDARAQGRAIWFEEFADTIMAASGGKVVFNRFVAPKVIGMPGDEEVAAAGVAEMGPIMDYFETQAPAEGWLVGEFSIGDISVASMLRTLGYVGLEPDSATHPRTAAWYDRVKARASWVSVAETEAKALAAFA